METIQCSKLDRFYKYDISIKISALICNIAI